MIYYSSIDIAEITGLSRPYLSARCKDFKIQLVNGKYLMILDDWINLLLPKHRSKLINHVFKSQSLKYIPIFYGVLRVTETYYVIPSKLNYLETL